MCLIKSSLPAYASPVLLSRVRYTQIIFRVFSHITIKNKASTLFLDFIDTFWFYKALYPQMIPQRTGLMMLESLRDLRMSGSQEGDERRVRHHEKCHRRGERGENK